MAKNLQDLFDGHVKDGSDLIASPPITLADLSSSFIDSDAILSTVDLSTRVVPRVDYTDFKNFVFFNSALDYFNISGERIVNEYPADGRFFDLVSFTSASDGYQRQLLSDWPKLSGSGLFSTAVSVGGQVPKVKVNDPLGELSFQGSFTIEAHLSLSGAPPTPRSIVSMYRHDGLDRYNFVITPALVPQVNIFNTGTSLVSTAPITQDTNYLACSVDRSSTFGFVTATFYSAVPGTTPAVLGSPVVSALPTTLSASSGFGVIGAFVSGTNAFAGKIGELRMWDTARTRNEIVADYNVRVYANEHLHLYYRFAEGYAGPSLNARTLVRDYSGNDFDGQLLNASVSGTPFWTTDTLGMSPQDTGEPVLFMGDADLVSFVRANQGVASDFDRNNQNLITRLVPAQFLILEDDRNTEVLKHLLFLLGRNFDDLKLKIDQFVHIFQGNYTQFDQAPDALLSDALSFWGWNPKGSFLSKDAFQYFFGYNVLSGSSAEFDNQRLDTTLQGIKNEFWRRTLSELPRIYKTKGTRDSVEALLRVYGLDEHLVKLKEFGLKPDSQIQTFRINSEKSAWAARFDGHEPAIETTGQPVSFITSSTVDVTVRFPPTGSPEMPVTMASGAIFHCFQGTTGSPLAEPLAMPMGDDPAFSGSLVIVEEVRYVRETGNTGRLLYVTQDNNTTDVQDMGVYPIFDGNWYHLMVHKDGNTVMFHVQRLDDDEIVMNDERAAFVASTLQPGSYDFSIGGHLIDTGQMWVNNVKVWEMVNSEDEMDNMTLNPFSAGTDTPERAAKLSLWWKFDRDFDTDHGLTFDSSPHGTHGTPIAPSFERFMFDYNFIAPPEYGWNEEKIRSLDTVRDELFDHFTESNAVALEFNLIDALNEDISYMMASLDNWNNVIGDYANRHRDSYPVLDQVRRQYFTRLSGRINFRVFADFLDFFDRSFVDLVQRLLPARANFKGAEFVVESHMLERPKVVYGYRRRNPDFEPEGVIIITGHNGNVVPNNGLFYVSKGFEVIPSGSTVRVGDSFGITGSIDGSPVPPPLFAMTTNGLGTLRIRGNTVLFTGQVTGSEVINVSVIGHPELTGSVPVTVLPPPAPPVQPNPADERQFAFFHLDEP